MPSKLSNDAVALLTPYLPYQMKYARDTRNFGEKNFGQRGEACLCFFYDTIASFLQSGNESVKENWLSLTYLL